MKTLSAFFVLLATVASAQTTRTGDYRLDKTYKIDEKGTIDLRSSDAKVFITGSKRADVHVKIDRVVESRGVVMGESEFMVEVDESNGNLRIEERQHSNVSIIGSYHEDYTINIEAPSGVSLRIRGDDGRSPGCQHE